MKLQLCQSSRQILFHNQPFCYHKESQPTKHLAKNFAPHLSVATKCVAFEFESLHKNPDTRSADCAVCCATLSLSQIMAQNTTDNLNDLEESEDDFDELDTDNLDELDPAPSSKQAGDGLAKDEKQLLLKCVDKKGGLSFCTRDTGLVEEICNWKPALFGLAKSPKRRATQNVINKWKQHARKNKFCKIHDWLKVPKPKNVSDALEKPTTPTTTTTTTRATRAAKAAATTTASAPVESIVVRSMSSCLLYTSPSPRD